MLTGQNQTGKSSLVAQTALTLTKTSQAFSISHLTVDWFSNINKRVFTISSISPTLFVRDVLVR